MHKFYYQYYYYQAKHYILNFRNDRARENAEQVLLYETHMDLVTRE